MNPALLLIDLQRDFLDRPGLFPRADSLIHEAQTLLHAFRELRLPVVHLHTQVRRDGSDRMPHWKRENTWACVEGSSGAKPPEPLRPLNHEPLFFKQHWSPFSNDHLAAALQKLQIDALIVVGLYLHGCIRAATIDAYQHGYEVWIAQDAVGSADHVQAEMTRIDLDGRAARFLETADILSRLGMPAVGAGDRTAGDLAVPVANIGGSWLPEDGGQRVAHRNPAHWSEILAWVPVGTQSEVNRAGAAARGAQSDWNRTPRSARARILEGWAAILAERSDALVKALAREIGKPMAEGREEVSRAIAQVRHAAALCAESRAYSVDALREVGARFQPQGVVGLITPWNNPLAIPLGKIAPALALGNAVVWKPALESARVAMAVMDSLHEAGAARGLVNLVFGNSSTARLLIDCRGVDSISLTGSVASGRSAAARCAYFGKPLQAELGGNNAAIVLNDCDVEADARDLAKAAFSFAGQRCTALRRIIVERAVWRPFQQAFVEATKTLRLGEPCDPHTDIGPLISRKHRQFVQSALALASSQGAECLCGGALPSNLEHGCWLTPAVVGRIEPDALLVREETFGPVAVMLPADDLEEAIELANSVEHGLVAALYSRNDRSRRRFAEAIQAGVLKFSAAPLRIDPGAPFGGWKASGIGPPEHGLGDLQYYARPQATYGWPQMISIDLEE